MCVLVMLKNGENNGTEEIGLVTPTPGAALAQVMACCLTAPNH